MISENATIGDILSKLDNPTEYIRRVLANMHLCRKEFGSALVRIGTTGQGVAPHYRIEPEPDLQTLAENWDAHFTAYHGRSHKRLDWGFGELEDDHWSDESLTFEQVQSLLGDLRKSKPIRMADIVAKLDRHSANK
ncbi:MAG: hypothetical protein RIB43_15710 [Rhodospirillaceae bacterium]